MSTNENELTKQLVITMNQLITKTLDLEIKTRVMSDLLIKNGTTTKNELNELYDIVEARDFTNTRKELMEELAKLKDI